MDDITIQGLDGRLMHVQVKHIVSMAEAKQEGGQATSRVRCVVSMSDGKFLTIVEACDSLRKRIKGE